MEDKEYEWILKHFQQMELRYHTWMNYYSLFNGALLVAYCTLLVSVGAVCTGVEDKELLSLKCTYWEFLTLIAGLGLFASACWLLSMKGHVAWLNSWRWALRSKGYEFDHTIYVSNNKKKDADNKEEDPQTESEIQKAIGKLPLYSTAKITTCFIGAIIVAWLFAMIYSCSKGVLSNYVDCFRCGLFGITIVAVLSLFILGRKRDVSLKSDTTGFDLKRVPLKGTPQPSVLRQKIIQAIELIEKLCKNILEGNGADTKK